MPTTASDEDGRYWIPSCLVFHKRDKGALAIAEFTETLMHFFVPRRIEDAFGNSTFVDYNDYDLLPGGT